MYKVGELMITFDEIKDAHDALRGIVKRTPLEKSKTFSKMTNSNVYLKLENLQNTRSFKIKDAYNKIRKLSEKEKENDFDVVVAMDEDGQYDADEIPNLLKLVLEGKADMSIDFRFGRLTEMPLWRKVGKRVLDYATGVGVQKIANSQCGFRAFNRKAVEGFVPRLRGNGFSVESEHLILAKGLNLKIAEVRISCKYKNLKISKKNPFSHRPSVLGYIIWLVAERRLK